MADESGRAVMRGVVQYNETVAAILDDEFGDGEETFVSRVRVDGDRP